VEGNTIRNVEGFTSYLGSNLTHNLDSEGEVRTHMAKSVLNPGRSSTFKMPTKMKILNTTVFSTALYRCETWIFTPK